MPKAIRYLIVAALAVTCMVIAGISMAQETPGQITICVLPFEVNASPDLQYLQADLPRLLADELRAQGFTVVPHEEMSRAITSSGVQFLDLETAKKLAVLTGAQYALYGSFSQAGDFISIDSRLVEAFGVEPPTPLHVTQQGLMGVLPAVQELAKKVRGQILVADVISSIQVQGTDILDDDVVLMRLRIQEGDMYDPAALDEEIKRVFDLGYFEDVSVDVVPGNGGMQLTFIVVERPRIGAISVVGSDEIDEDDILDIMSTKPGSVLNPRLLADDLNSIRDLYKQEGLFGTEVEYELEQGDSAQARLNIIITETPKLYVTEIVINGNEMLDDGDVEDALLMSESSILTWFSDTDVLSQDLINHDIAAIDKLYHDNGFLDVQVGQPEVEYLEEGIRVTYDIVEGPQYFIRDVTFAGDVLVPDDILLEGIELDDWAEDEGYFNRSVMHDDEENLTRFYNDFGYAYAEVIPELDIDREELLVDVIYRFNKSHKVLIRRVIIEGNDDTRDNVIRRDIMLGDGNLFSGTALRSTQMRLERLQLFETVEIEPVPTDDPEYLDLVVTVKEQPTGSVTGGIGYSTSDSVMFQAAVQESNLLGLGYELRASASIGLTDNSTYDIGFTNPRLYDSLLSMHVGTSYLIREYSDYDRRALAARLRFGYPIGEWSKVIFGYNIEQYTLYNVDDDASDYILESRGENWASIVDMQFVRDTTDRMFNPTSGNTNSLYFSYGGGLIGGDDNFFKIIADTNWYFLLLEDLGHVLHLHAQAGTVFENSSDNVPVHQRFFLGGMQNIRGYGNNDISPFDDGDRIGGDMMFFTNVEYLFPLEEEFGLMGVLFFDMGDAWGGGDHDYMTIKKSIGAGVRWYSPFGPMRIEMGYGLDEIRDQGDRFRIDFSVGQFF